MVVITAYVVGVIGVGLSIACSSYSEIADTMLGQCIFSGVKEYCTALKYWQGFNFGYF